MEIAEDCWAIIHDIWHELNDEYGYTPLMCLFRTSEFRDKWLEYVRGN